MHIRVLQTEPSGNVIAWYQKLSTSLPINGGGVCDENNDVLVWSEEFDVDGAPNTDNWGYDLGGGGWGNQEEQYYTDRPENVIVEGGFLKIKTIAEPFNGSEYTSARILSKDKFEFKYGRVVARARFPEGAGTWPAIWMLGANFETMTWPACGEIDIVEHRGNEQNTIHGSLHYPGNSAGNANSNTTIVANVSSEFHEYEVLWTESCINFYVDGEEYHTFSNTEDEPFKQDFFLILNTAMGGTFGGSIDPNFSDSTFEVDYIRVYQ
jgi:beta-glucanase (GH16 family)